MGDDLAGAFLGRLDPAVSCDAARLQVRLETACAAAEARWAPIAVPRDAFAAYLAERLPEAGGDVEAALDDLEIEALYLACACVRGDEAALRAFEEAYFGAARRALAGLDRTGALADEAIQAVRDRLFLDEPGRPPKVADYLGRGQLHRWVRAVAVRVGLDLLRASRRHEARRADDEVLAALPGDDPDPELAHLQELYGGELRAAFAEALGAAPARQRAVLRYHFVDGLNIDQIAGIYKVHRTTAFRWLERARRELVGDTRRRMRWRLGVDRGELASIMRLIRSQLELSVRRLLDGKSAGR